MKHLTLTLAALSMALTSALAQAETGTLLVERTDARDGKNISYAVFADQHYVGRLHSHSQVSLELKPGHYTLSTNMPDSETLEITVVQGEITRISSGIETQGRLLTASLDSQSAGNLAAR